ncbi:MAG: T9SS type A sorting domain-containing protein [Bacteroidetes bacterium]|nr:T9SS type A sorting domain-containing protein [Bacteroidota bacterium]HET6243734.1 T9SS type A sorting domain-containing protein [Bacteroidia bacterium]
MKKHLSILFISITLLGLKISSAQVFEWGISQSWLSVDVDIDNFGNSFNAGSFQGTTVVGSNSYTSAGGVDVIISKINPSGTLLWSTVMGGVQNDNVAQIHYDGNGNVWVIGNFSGVMTIGTFTISAGGGTDVFIAKLDAASGTVLAALKGGGSGNDQAIQLASDAAGNIYVCGTYVSSFTIGTVNITGSGSLAVFLTKLDAAAVPQWGTSIHNQSLATTWTMNVDAAGNSYIGGFANSVTSNFGSTVVTMNQTKTFIAKFNTLGVYQWAALAQMMGELMGVCNDAAGNTYVSGNFNATAVFGSTTLNGPPLNDDILLAKVDASGNWVWAKQYGGNGNDGGYDLTCNANGNLFLAASIEASFTLGNTNVSSGGYKEVVIAGFNSNGDDLWVIQTLGPGSNFIYSITHDDAGGIYICGYGQASMTFAGAPVLTSGGEYLIKISNNANTISGTVFRDYNNDGIMNGADSGIPNVMTELNPGSSLFSSSYNGKYNAYALAGSWIVQLPVLPPYYSLTTPATQSGVFTGIGQLDTANHFGLYAIPNMNDLRVTVTPLTSPKAGFVLNYYVTYENTGTTTLNGNIDFTFPSLLSYIGASPPQTSQVGQTLSWNIGSIPPQTIGTINVLFNIPTSVTIGTPVNSIATITPVVGDMVSGDNTDQSLLVVVGPYDPNYKEVDPLEMTPTAVSEGTWLNYTVHFQNVGNAPAHTVILKDSLSQNLLRSSLQILAYSHPVAFNINPSGIAEFRFDNIMLIDSVSDPVASCGFVKFRVKPIPTLQLGDSIPNFADIYFDYNPPITTNTAVTRIELPAGIKNTSDSPFSVKIYPVPSPGKFTLELETDNAEDMQISIYNALGQQVYNETINKISGLFLKEIDLQQRNNGIYFIQVAHDGKTSTQKILLHR